ncbi:viscotoxin-A3 [Eggerthellaceae bacterium zg-887]|uniref:viscotoxin-A3 n=1 Tax=Xiamenia xianingshaonis TaxID=2682776 RepID=UPI00140CAF09|nr:viscotoxin-A3 [Xiamenia xianingshaonis]NHM15990.1 viscotoxin-A3 [Xiamenia xianingshaonis]
MAELTDEQIAREEEFLKGLPRVNLGALFMPPVWGAAHGFWVTLLFYPVWLLADNCFFAAYCNPSVLSIGVAVLVFVSLLVVTVVFAIVSQPIAAHRAENAGVSRERYLKRQRAWAVACIVAGLVMIAAATYYNLAFRPPFEA